MLLSGHSLAPDGAAAHPCPSRIRLPESTRARACGGADSLDDRLFAPARNLELKARDPDPARSLERALALGAEDRGEIAQRDTYFARATGRLKLREQTPGDAELIQYRRADEPGARTSHYRIVAVPDPETLKEALDAALGTLVVVEKRRRLLLAGHVRIHLDDVEGLGSFIELEAVGDDDPAAIERLREQLDTGEPIAGSYSDLLLDARETLLAAATAAMRNAHAPYSGFKVGAALRAPGGGIYSGANVENASYPQGQCAEASAIGALVAAGEREIDAIAVVAEQRDVCPPCGGCRQRLSEFAGPHTPVHLGSTTTTLGELLPMAFDLARSGGLGPARRGGGQ
jgi:homotetrameric cytidine deaminase